MDSSLKINNRRVSYSDVGEGKVIVFLHGWMDSKKAYEKITEILSKKYRKGKIPEKWDGKAGIRIAKIIP